MSEISTNNLVGLAADIVSAYVTNNSVPAADLPSLIATVHSSLRNVSNPAPAQATEKPTPAVPIKKSVTPEAIISLIDGKPYRTMKRHLTRHGLTPAQYRERFGLPHDYPVVAPAYAAKRSELARSAGLGQQRRKAAAKTASTSERVTGEAPAKKRGRKKAA
jgi:predicted transcriptional regulator